MGIPEAAQPSIFQTAVDEIVEEKTAKQNGGLRKQIQ
jgi:hypothetical protein